jgi:hypothetical protein
MAAPAGYLVHAGGGEWQYSGVQLTVARTAWMWGALLAAILVRGDRWGLGGAWLGSLAGLRLVLPELLSYSPTTRDNPYYLALEMVVGAMWSAVQVGMWAIFVKVVGTVVPSGARRRVLLGTLATLIAAALVTLSLRPAPRSGPEPAPTAPPALSARPLA